ncbi:hypothetical protein [Palleronia sp. LCG004]|uniref:hypothetical protein n=1 Tax=Palleronia sp. LCG004 TaxID=3079304 RepID=UPI0029437046|nr:hypothetical protein [Palleronia sp. LCG004]WOI57068.1 hypothetical protein RVY76_04570 [Palleronia sp. LCG004]
MKPARDPLVTFNERVKLLSSTINALGLGMVGFAVLRPLTDSIENVSRETGYWAIMGLVVHLVSHYILRYLRKV